MIVNFWATWNKPSLKILDDLKNFGHDKEKIRLVFINLDENFETAAKYLEEHNIAHSYENFHLNQSSSDLIYGATAAIRVALIDKA